MNKEEMGQAVFGSFDGMTSLWGVLVVLASKPSKTLLVAAAGLAIASTIGMAAGEFLGDTESSYSKAAVMGAATAIGTMAPVLPFLVLSRAPAFACAIVITLALCAFIGFHRGNSLRAYVQTYAILFTVAIITGFFSLITGSG